MDVRPSQPTVLHGTLPAYLSWSQPFLHALLRGLEPQCRNVIVCNRTENLDRFPIDNIVRLKMRDLVHPSRALIAALRLTRDWQPEVIHAHFGWSGIRMLLLKQLLQRPMVTTFGGRDAGTQMHMPHYDRLYGILLNATDQIVCVSEDLKHQLVECGVEADRIEVIRRGTDLKKFRYVDRSAREPNRPIQLLMVGRLVEKKGHRFAFDAVARLVQRGINVSLNVVGEGETYNQLRRLRNRLGLREHVQLAGPRNHAGVRRLMSDADIFVHCSVTGATGDCEGIPNVIVEAAATGLPIVGTRHGGIVETVRHGDTGLLVDEADVDGLADAIETLARCRETRLAFGEAGSRFMHRHFDLQQQVDRYAEIYDRLIGEYRSGEVRTPKHFVPDDFPQVIASTLHPQMGVRDFSIAELSAWLLESRRMSNGHKPMSTYREFIERCYNLKRYVPQVVKFPVKAALGHSMAIVIERMNSRTKCEDIAQLRKNDQSVLAYFRNGGGLDQLPREWESDEVFDRLPQLIESKVSESGIVEANDIAEAAEEAIAPPQRAL